MKKMKGITFSTMNLTFRNVTKSGKNLQGKSLYDGEVFVNDKKVHRQLYYAKNLVELKKILNNSYKIRVEHL